MRVFLAAEWRWLAMLNWRVPAELLEPLVPRGTELDRWRGDAWVSIVGFLFRDTRVLGVPIPWHRDFEELNLRFYVKRHERDEIRRGVCFIREIVPRVAIATVARLAYNEPYVALPMRHTIGAMRGDGAGPELVEYAWRHPRGAGRLRVTPIGAAAPLRAGSAEEFITEHYWGYTRQRDGGTVEYRVEHPRWNVWGVSTATIDGPLEALYGEAMAAVLRRPPDSGMLADGSPVTVSAPRRLPP